MKHYSFPSIDQFRSVVKHVNDRCRIHGLTVKPKLLFHGTVKLHGTNSAICYHESGDFSVQSRTRVITPEEDNAGFARWVDSARLKWETALKSLLEVYNTVGFLNSQDYDRPPAQTIAIYGEWCGKGIQKGVSINNLEKMFVIFGMRFIRDGLVKEDQDLVPGTISNWLLPWELEIAAKLLHPTAGLFCIEDFPTFKMLIDFENPGLSQNELSKLTLEVEEQCPVSYAMLKFEPTVLELVNGKVISDKPIHDFIKDKFKPILQQLLSEDKNPRLIINL
jgi:hypothetical protein